MEPIEAPKIDYRSETELLSDLTTKIVEHSTVWTPETEDPASPAPKLKDDPFAQSIMKSFIHIFQVMQERLNKVADKHFIAFLDMLAVKLRHPEPARSPISFFLTKGAKRWTVVPAGTQVASDTPEAPTPVVFETMEDIAVVLPRPVKAVSVRPSEDTHTFHKNGLFSVDENTVETFFNGLDALPHRLYMGAASLGELLPKDNVKVILEFNTKTDADLFLSMQNSLLYFNDELAEFVHIEGVTFLRYAALSQPDKETLNTLINNDVAIDLTESQQNVYVVAAVDPGTGYTIEVPLDRTPAATALSGSSIGEEDDLQYVFNPQPFELENVWLALEAVPRQGQALSLKENAITLRDVKFSYGIFALNQTTLIDTGYFNRSQIDLSKDYFALGERPKFNDTFYFACEEFFSKESGSLQISFTLSSSVPFPYAVNSPLLVWEYYGENGWEQINWGTDNGTSAKWDETLGLTHDPAGNADVGSAHKEVKISVTIEPGSTPLNGKVGKFVKTKVNSKENFWMRFRLDSGDYGSDLTYIMEEYTNNGYTLYRRVEVPKTLAPPCIEEVKVTYIPLGGLLDPESFIAFNNYYYRDFTDLRGVGFNPFSFIYDKTPALYIGFNESLSELPITLFFSLLKQDKMSELYLLSSEPPQVFWEYWDDGWKTLQVDDRTGSLRSRDIVKFRAPETLEKSMLFSEELYWIRARLEREEPSLILKCDGLYNNVAWAHQQITVTNELLGSGNGLSGQKLTFKNKPVLTGEKVYVLDEIISDDEKNKYRKVHGADSVVEKYNSFTNKIETWVQWMPVEHFHFSDKNSRHYYIDRIKGEITFGDNKSGLIPPRAKNNIRCFEYRYGGGEQGNLSFGTIKKLRTSIPYVDAAVNFLPSFGGEKADDVPTLLKNAPDLLKSGNRAITADDYIFMVKQASGQVSRVKCLPTTDISGTFRPGYITLMVLPFSNAEKPVLDSEIIDDIEAYLAERMVYNLKEANPKQVNLVSPKYIKCSVDVVIAEYTDINLSLSAENEIRSSLADYFHANRGGPGGTGWPFGRNVPVSELIQIAEKAEAVSLISNISIKTSSHQFQFTLNAAKTPGVTFPKHSVVELSMPWRNTGFPCKFRFYLPEPVVEGVPITEIVAIGFKEGDRIQIETTIGGLPATTEILLVSDAGYDYLNIESVHFPYPIEAGSKVRTVDGRVESYLLDNVPSGRTTHLHIAVPEKPDHASFLFPQGDLTLIHSREEHATQKLVAREISREISSVSVIPSMQQFWFVITGVINVSFAKFSPVEIVQNVAAQNYRLKYYLKSDLSREDQTDRFIVVGFQVGDTIQVVDANQTVLFETNIIWTGLDFLNVEGVIVLEPILKGTMVRTVDGRVESYLLNDVPADPQQHVTKLSVARPGEPVDGVNVQDGTVTLFQYADNNIKADETFNLVGARISTQETPMKVVYLEDNYLTYSGEHSVEQEGV